MFLASAKVDEVFVNPSPNEPELGIVFKVIPLAIFYEFNSSPLASLLNPAFDF